MLETTNIILTNSNLSHAKLEFALAIEYMTLVAAFGDFNLSSRSYNFHHLLLSTVIQLIIIAAVSMVLKTGPDWSV